MSYFNFLFNLKTHLPPQDEKNSEIFNDIIMYCGTIPLHSNKEPSYIFYEAVSFSLLKCYDIDNLSKYNKIIQQLEISDDLTRAYLKKSLENTKPIYKTLDKMFKDSIIAATVSIQLHAMQTNFPDKASASKAIECTERLLLEYPKEYQAGYEKVKKVWETYRNSIAWVLSYYLLDDKNNTSKSLDTFMKDAFYFQKLLDNPTPLNQEQLEHAKAFSTKVASETSLDKIRKSIEEYSSFQRDYSRKNIQPLK